MAQGKPGVLSSRMIIPGVAGVFLMLFLVPGTNCAERDHELARQLKERGMIVPVEQLLHALNKDHRVRILDIKLETRDQRLIYLIEYVAAEGVVWINEYDATSGALLHSRKDE